MIVQTGESHNMNKILKKAIVILMCLTFLFTAAASSSALIVEDEQITTPKEETTEPNVLVKEITVYRYGPDGFIKPVKVTISFDENDDVGAVVAEKCEELFDNDVQMQAALQGNNSSSFILKRVTSYGRGIHFKLSPKFQFSKIIKLLPFLPPYLKTALFLPIRYCKYTRDPGAYTRISGLNSWRNITQEYRGPHEILSIGFIGYTGWVGHISYLGFFIRTGFAGVSGFTKANEI